MSIDIKIIYFKTFNLMTFKANDMKYVFLIYEDKLKSS